MVSTETSSLWSATIGSVGIGLALTGIHLAHRELKSLALEPEKAEFKRVQDRAFSVRTGLEEELFRAQDFADLLSSRAPLPQSRTSRLTQVYLDIDEWVWRPPTADAFTLTPPLGVTELSSKPRSIYTPPFCGGAPTLLKKGTTPV